MPLKQVSRERYEALHREALFILEKMCQHGKHTDHENLAHLSVEIYFTMKRDTKNSISLEQAAFEALSEKPCQVNYERTYASNTDAQREAQRDLDKIYAIVHDSLSLQEKYLFCLLLKDVPPSEIRNLLGLKEADFMKVKATLIRKLRDAATSPQSNKSKNNLCRKLKPSNISH